jgi:CMP/dCMP kinase
MYRALTLKAMRNSLDLEDESSLSELARSTEVDLEEGCGSLKVFLDGEEVSGLIRTPELTNNVKFIARVPGVRKEMIRLQRLIGERSGAVLEGRDIGTVVFPDADYKFYLDADLDERARRRYKELTAAGQKINLDVIKDDVVIRDKSDMTRSVGALKVAHGAIVIDTTDLSIDEVFDKVMSHIKK